MPLLDFFSGVNFVAGFASFVRITQTHCSFGLDQPKSLHCDGEDDWLDKWLRRLNGYTGGRAHQHGLPRGF